MEEKEKGKAEWLKTLQHWIIAVIALGVAAHSFIAMTKHVEIEKAIIIAFVLVTVVFLIALIKKKS